MDDFLSPLFKVNKWIGDKVNKFFSVLRTVKQFPFSPSSEFIKNSYCLLFRYELIHLFTYSLIHLFTLFWTFRLNAFTSYRLLFRNLLVPYRLSIFFRNKHFNFSTFHPFNSLHTSPFTLHFTVPPLTLVCRLGIIVQQKSLVMQRLLKKQITHTRISKLATLIKKLFTLPSRESETLLRNELFVLSSSLTFLQ